MWNICYICRKKDIFVGIYRKGEKLDAAVIEEYCSHEIPQIVSYLPFWVFNRHVIEIIGNYFVGLDVIICNNYIMKESVGESEAYIC